MSTDGGATVDVGVVGPLLACVLGGYGLGALAFRRLGPGRFFPIVLGLVVCAGIASALAGVLYASRGACAT